jgi:hypothetical protein
MKNESLDLSLQDVLLLVGMQERTGELDLESGNNIGSILFYRGAIRHASSPYARAIGDLLVEDGLISEADLIETLSLQKTNRDTPVGILLLNTGKVTFEIIEMMVHEQIRNSMKEFQTWKGIKYSFVNKEIKPCDRISLPVHEFVGSSVLQSAAKFLAMPSPQVTS